MSQMLFDQKLGPQGIAVTIDNLKTLSQLNQINIISAGTAGNVTPSLLNGSMVVVNITANVAITIQAPTNLPLPLGPGSDSKGVEWNIFVQNLSGGALTTQPVFSGSFRLSGAIPAIANGQAFSVAMFFDGTKHTSIGGVSATAY